MTETPTSSPRGAGGVSLLAAVLLLSGCRTTTPPPAAPLDGVIAVPDHYRATADAEPAERLATIDDAALAVLIREALDHNPDLHAASATWREARAHVRRAAAALRPTLDGTADVSRSRTVARGAAFEESRFEFGVAAAWELDLWGRLAADEAASERDGAAVLEDVIAARHSLAALVAETWTYAIEATRRLEIHEALLELETRTQSVTEDLIESGVGAPLDATIANANVALAHDDVVADRAAIDDLRRALEMLLGRYPATELEIAASFPSLPETAAVGLPARLLETRPDLRAAEHRIAAAYHRGDSARAARLPAVQLTASLGALLDPSNTIWSVGGGLLAPLFDGGRRAADVEIATAQQEQAVAAYIATAIAAFGEVESILQQRAVLHQRAALLDAASTSLEKAGRIGQDRYEAGIISIVDLTAIRRQATTSAIEWLGVRGDRVRQHIALAQATGRPAVTGVDPAVDPIHESRHSESNDG